jgi:SPP1 family predicted phage head-tail adaptor
VIRPRTGALRHRIDIEAATRTGNGSGGAVEAWSSVAQVWASIDAQTGDERVRSEGISGQVSHRIHLRYRADLTPAHRFRFGARVFDILAVLDVDERRRFLRCLCQERDL